MHYPRPESDVQPIKSDGSQPVKNKSGATLASGSTYYYELGGEAATLQSIHIQWDAAIIITSIEVEDSDFQNVTSIDATAGNWIKMNPATGVWDVFVVGAGASVTASTIAVTGGAAGGGMISRRDAALRSRLKIVVAGTGGVVRVATHGKA